MPLYVVCLQWMYDLLYLFLLLQMLKQARHQISTKNLPQCSISRLNNNRHPQTIWFYTLSLSPICCFLNPQFFLELKYHVMQDQTALYPVHHNFDIFLCAHD